MNDDLSEPTTSRRGFLRKMGTTIAVGIGVAAVPALAKASPQFVAYVCCADTAGHCSNMFPCGGGRSWYWCYNPECHNGYCWGCKRDGTQCFDDVQPGCV
jgi:hypothetical protein